MNKQFYAIFMIVIILCMPIAFAQATILNVNVYGQDSTNGYSRELNDDTTVEALVSISDDDLITADQIKIEDLEFDSCIDEGTNFKCKYVEDNSFFEAKSYPFTVTLYDDNGISVATKSTSVTIDNIIPEIKDLIIQQVGENVKVTYSLTDKACDDESCSNKCSGFSKIDFVGIKQINLNATGQCSYTGTEILELESGTYTLNVNVYDGVGNLGNYISESFTIDKTLPKIETNELLFIKEGKEISYVGINGLDKVDVLLYIEELNIDQVSADLSPLNKITHYKITYENLKASCNDLGGVQLCRWNGINLLPDTPSGTIDVTIKDKSGNSITESIPYSLELDNVQPQILSIETKCSSGLCYLRENNNTIIAKISESGSGFNRAFLINGKKQYLVALNLGQLSSRYSKEWADECEQENNAWKCYWYNIDVTKPHGSFIKISVAEGSQDDAGNTINGILENEFIVDRKAPEIKEINVDSGQLLGYVLQGEGLNVKLTLTEDSPVTAIGKFGGVINDGRDYEEVCTKSGDNEYICEWNKIGAIVPGPMKDARYSIELLDFSGNSFMYNNTVDIVEAEGLPKNYWRYEGELITRPSAISKDTLFKSQKVYFLLPLKSSVNEIKVVDAALSSCSVNTGLELNEKVLVTENGIFVTGTTSQGLDASYGSISADCTLRLVSVIDRTRIAQPQDIAIKLSLPIVDSKQGSVNARVTDKIKSAKEEAKMSGVFNVLQKMYDIAERVCAGVKLVNSATNLFKTLQVPFAKWIDVARTNPTTKPAGETANKAQQTAQKSTDTVLENINKELKKFCGYMSCDRGAFGPKMSEFYDKMSKSEFNEQTGQRVSTSANYAPGMWPKNPKDNLILSAAMGCIPGVLYNLKKRQQIQCMYIDCLQNQVPKGVPVAFCDAQVGYQECRFVYGQVFGVIPYSHVAQQFGNTIKNLFHDPVSLVMGIGTYLCSSPSATSNAICNLLRSTTSMKSVMTDWNGIMNNKDLLSDFDKAGNVCKRVGIE